MPSPRHENFYTAMQESVRFAEDNAENIAKFWTKGYNRDKRWERAFTDGAERKQGYSRGYITWR
jgi:hypothetical protein